MTLRNFLYEGQLKGQTAFGLPQQTSVKYGDDNYHFRGNYWDLYPQDEWKMRSNLTLNLGVRYEYVSPLEEENNRIANLDLSPAVLNPALGTPAVALVLPDKPGPTAATFPPPCCGRIATISRPASDSLGSRSRRLSCAADTESTTTPAPTWGSRSR